MSPVQRVRGLDDTWLSASDVHEIARRLGIPVPAWRLVYGADEAVAAAERIGFPVVLKADSAHVVHKSEAGAVVLDLHDAASVRTAYEGLRGLDSLVDAPLLVQQMTRPGVEVIAGVFHDATFGPVLMTGLGGRLVELVDDVVFRLCPVDLATALDMLESLRCRRLLDGYRGGVPVDLTALAELLVRLSHVDDVVDDGFRIAEFEANPLVLADGRMCAVDIRAQLADRDAPSASRRPLPDLTALFRPSSVAMVGASRRPTISNKILRHIVDYGYPGELHPINASAVGQRIHGLPVAGTLEDIPQPVDYGIVAVPAAAVPETLRAAAGRMRFAHVITSGFAEEGERGRALQADLLDAARAAGTRVVGPNCLGLHSAAAGLTFVDGLDTVPGPVGVVAQSGGLGADILRQGQARGVRIGKLVTIGNAVDLTAEDFVEYFCDDPETTVIGLYLEGVSDGTRLAELLGRAAAADKPVVMLHGGRSVVGAQAVASHTGALAGEERLWAAMAEQTGCIYPGSLSTFLSALAGAAYLRPAAGGRVLLLGPSGGMSVLASDHCARLGLEIPPLGAQTRAGLHALDVPPGSSLSNPIDTPAGALAVGGGDLVPRIARTVLATESLDYVVIHLNAQNALSYTGNGAEILRNVAAAAADLHDELRDGGGDGQVVLALRGNGEPSIMRMCLDIAEPLWDRGVPVFLGLEEALDAVQSMTYLGRYRRRREADRLRARN